MGGNTEKGQQDDRDEKADFNLRIPKRMLQEAARIAGNRGLSLNAWLSNLIGKAIEENPKPAPRARL